MNGFERVRAAIRFGTPDRLPVTGSMMRCDFSGDTVAVFAETGFEHWLGGGGEDEWGCLWVVDPAHPNMGQVKNRVLTDLEAFAEVRVPDAADPTRYAHLPGILDRAEREGRYVVMCNGSLVFERMHFLYGFEETLVAIIQEPDLTRRFAEHLARFHIDTVQTLAKLFPGRIHGYRGTDDWGSQLAPFISPAMFATVFQPVYASLFASCHDAGMDTWMHSCGQVVPLIEHFIDMGVHIAQLSQPQVYPMPAIKPFAGRIAFEMNGDVQMTAETGDEKRIADEVAAIVDATCTPAGGLVVQQIDPDQAKANELPGHVAGVYAESYRRLDPYAN